MNNSTTFKLAHTMTKQIIKAGDNYQVTFGLCLKQVKAQSVAVIQVTTTCFKNTDAETLTVNFLMLVTIMLMVIKLVNFLNDIKEPVFLIIAFIINPFNLVMYNGIYLAITGG